MQHSVLFVRARLLPLAKYLSRRTVHHSKRAAHHTWRFSLFAHHHLAVRPHNKLKSKYKWYSDWHSHPGHHRIHASALALFLVVVGIAVFNSYSAVRALSDLSDSFSFSNPSDYTADSGAEITGGVARLKAQNYSSDANTAALYHFDESSGSTAYDSSSHANNATAFGSPTFSAGNLNNGVSLNGNNTAFSAQSNTANSLTYGNTIESWIKFNSTFNTNRDQDQYIVDKGSYKLYYDHSSGKITYELGKSGSQTWSKQSSSAWSISGKASAYSQVVISGNVYYGLGDDTATVWKYNGTSTTQIGGDGINSSWTGGTKVAAMTNNGNTLYVGVSNARTSSVWSCDVSTGCTSWTQVVSSSQFQIQHPYGSDIKSMYYQGGYVYVGSGELGSVARLNTSNLTYARIGGFSDNGSWNSYSSPTFTINALTGDGSNIYAAISWPDNTVGGQVYKYNGSTWTKIGGNSINSGWPATYQAVLSMTYFGGNLYAGVGNDVSAGLQVWKWNGSSWTKLGDTATSTWAGIGFYKGIWAMTNDGTNLYISIGSTYYYEYSKVFSYNGSTWTALATHGNGANQASPSADRSLVYSGGTLYAASYDNGSADGWAYTGGTWTRLTYPVPSFGTGSYQSVTATANFNGKQYVGISAVTGEAAVWENNNGSWTQVGGPGIRSAAFTGASIKSLATYNGKLYAGTQGTTGAGQVWSYDGSTWTKVGGNSVNSSWSNASGVLTLSVYNGNLYAGTGGQMADTDVWKYNGSSWTQVGGDGLNSSWSNLGFQVSSSIVYKGDLYVGFGPNSAAYGKVYKYNGSSWTQVAGDNLNSSWNNIHDITTMAVYGNKLYVGTGSNYNPTTGIDNVWSYDGSTWSKVGGAGLGGSWSANTYYGITSLSVYNGQLYAGTNGTAGTGSVWTYNGSAWTKVAGASVNNSWDNTNIEAVYSLGVYNGKLYSGTGNTIAADAQVWAYGGNNVLRSTSVGQDTGWHHIAATYDGSTMKIYIDGTLNASAAAIEALPTNSLPLYIGTSAAGVGSVNGTLDGKMDELRISNIARTSFTTTPYSTAAQAVTLNDPIRQSGVWHWDSLSDSVSGGGSVKYRLSTDGGTTWLYWNGSAWATSASYAQANDTATITANMSTLPVTFDGMKWQAILQGNGVQQVTVNSVADTATADFTAPSANASSITAQKANGGAALNAGAWTNGSSPYFSWSPGDDTQSGIKGYCAYLGTDNTADPVTTKGLLGVSPVSTGNNCPFIISGNSLDTGTAGYLATALTSSNSPYYLRLKAIDNAGNIISSTDSFSFKFDNTPPTNPSYVTAPAGFVATKQVTLTWPTSGPSAASDANSGTVGLQYRINNSTWYGDSHTGTGDSGDLLADDGSYTTINSPDFANLNEGVNTIYFRTWDAAGNVTTSYTNAAVRINTANAPSAPQGVTATPTVNTTNSFAFQWFTPDTFVGDENNLTYCYSINALPSAGNCTFTNGGAKSLAAGPYATQPDDNTFYVVARDESGQINYSNYGTVIFTANTPAPGIPLNVDVADVSIKATSNWRLALTWDTPSDVGSGVTQYKVYRSTNNVNFSLVGSSSATSYIDTGLSQQNYYYRVTACDSANKCGANSAVVSLKPTGKFTSPALLVSDPVTSQITTRKATIKWSTDRTSDSVIAIGTKSGSYSPAQTAVSDQVTSHEVNLDNLSAGTTYYYVAKWTDEDGNTGQSQEMSFRTAPAPVLKEITTNSIQLSSATIQFTSIGASKVTTYFGPTDAFGGLKSINTASSESTYNIDLTGLNDGTKYYYQLVAYDSEGNAYPGSIFSFTTPPRPRISNLAFQPLPGPPTSTQVVSWHTNVPTNSSVIYGKEGTNGTEITDPKMTTDHTITISGLDDDSEYFLIAQSRDADGNLAVSDRQSFRTALDTRAPRIYDVEIETTIRGTGAQARGQVVISWKTDELATSQVAYATGTTTTVYNNKTAEDNAYSLEHIVIISDLPTSQVYSMQPLSRDRSGNQAYGEAQTAIVGRGSDDVLTIVLVTLQKVFGF